MSIKAFIKPLIAIIWLLLLIWFIRWDQIMQTIRTADWRFAGVSLLLLPLNIYLQAVIWQMLVRRRFPEERFFQSLGAILVGQTLGLFTPARLGDFVGRAYYLDHQNKWELAALTGAQQLIALACYIGFGIPALLYFLMWHLRLHAFIWYLVLVAGIGTLLLLITVFLHPRAVYRFIANRYPYPHLLKTFGFLRHLRLQDVYWLFGLTSLRYVVFSVQCLLVLYAFGAQIHWTNAVLAIALFFYANSVIPSPALAGLGVREGSAVFFMGFFGVPAAIAFSTSLLLYVINIVLPAIIGLPLVLRLKLGTTLSVERALPKVNPPS
ncbi:MAG TPA: lysylphosphatidylglycerol synthase transmembrane domain-containing protein [Rhodothermales bacterium]|nr:lysylphosphatidylglycerol synthase transmembrane domain-containing protein [Rhodothermales bacterium]